MIRNPVYCGKIRIDAKGGEEEMIVEGIHEPIISEELFQQVQQVLSGRTKKMNAAKVNKVNEIFPLWGFMECPRCGKKLTGSGAKGNGGKHYYYHCLHGCKERVKAEEQNNAIIKLLRRYIFKPEIKDLFYKVVLDSIGESSKDVNIKRQKIAAEIEKTQKRLESLQDKYIDKEIGVEDYNRLKAKYKADIDSFIKQKSEINIITNDISAQLALMCKVKIFPIHCG